MLKAYLAGPGVFLPDPNLYFSKKRSICLKYNFIGISPFDSEVDISNKNPFDIGRTISSNNENLMYHSDLIIADITPYHGPSLDVGTAFEIGFMRALNKPLFAYSNKSKLFKERVEDFFGIKSITNNDFLDRHQINGMAIENFNMVDNLMIDGAIANSNSMIVKNHVDDSVMYTSLEAFENAVIYAASKLNH